MNSIPRTISVTELRNETKKIINSAISSNEPTFILYNSQMPVCLVSTAYLNKLVRLENKHSEKKDLKNYSGFLRDSKAFGKDAIKYQKKIRDDWKK